MTGSKRGSLPPEWCPTPVDAAWLAGFFEADGNAFFPPAETGHGVRLTIAQSSDTGPPVVLLRVQRITGIGTIAERGPSDRSVKQRWAWRVYNRRDALRILDAMAPYLTTPIEVPGRDAWAS